MIIMKSMNIQLNAAASQTVLKKLIKNAKFFWGMSINIVNADPSLNEHIYAKAYDIRSVDELANITTWNDVDALKDSLIGSVHESYTSNDMGGGDYEVYTYSKPSLILPEGLKIDKHLVILFTHSALDYVGSVTLYYS